jgi:PTH1 family peptidyl-tRNA hydrolase
VHDDLAIPLGTIKTRFSGGAGGHRGVASILEAFQSDAFRRIKVGVGPLPAATNMVDYVLTPLSGARRAALEEALSAAHARALELAATRSGKVGA